MGGQREREREERERERETLILKFTKSAPSKRERE